MRRHDFLVFTMDCSNATNAISHRGSFASSLLAPLMMIFSRRVSKVTPLLPVGRLSWTERIPPRATAVLHNLTPASPGTWAWSYECEWTREAALE